MLATVQSSALLLFSVLAIALSALSFLDCVRRPNAAFPAIGRQSKVLWLLLTGGATLAAIAWVRGPALPAIAAIVIAMVYLFDVRPRIKEITGR